jgi:hypothetical protein
MPMTRPLDASLVGVNTVAGQGDGEAREEAGQEEVIPRFQQTCPHAAACGSPITALSGE